MNKYLLYFTAIVACISSTSGFTFSSQNKSIKTFTSGAQHYTGMSTRIAAVEGEGSDDSTEKKLSLEEKMANWEASEEEIKAATLGGMTPGRGGTDGFDIGLYIAFPIIVATSLLFAVFPFIMDKIDVTSVGPPPTV
jgi:hypothetical protein